VDRYPLKRYKIMFKLPDGTTHQEELIANFGFDNGPEGVVFRRYEHADSARTTVVALYPEATMVRYVVTEILNCSYHDGLHIHTGPEDYGQEY
jgi:hypothetical protein